MMAKQPNALWPVPGTFLDQVIPTGGIAEHTAWRSGCRRMPTLLSAAAVNAVQSPGRNAPFRLHTALRPQQDDRLQGQPEHFGVDHGALLDAHRRDGTGGGFT